MDSGTTGTGAHLRETVRLMLVSLLVMMASIVVLYVTPLGVASVVAVTLYAGLWAYERRVGVASPVTRVMTVFYVLVGLARHLMDDLSWMAWLSPSIYLTLAALILVLLAAGRPFTAVYASDVAFPPLHRALSAVWGGLHLTAAVAALTMMPGMGFVYAPMGLMALGAFATVWLNFVSMGPAHGRRDRFQIEGYSFREARSAEDRETFYKVIAEAYRADIQRALGMRRRIDTAAIIREHRTSNAKWRDAFVPFLAFVGARPVAGICIFFDHKVHGLPIEVEAPVDLGPWRRTGAVAEVGRLGVLRRYRISPILLKGLFKCVIEAAAERGVHYIFNDSFDFQSKMYGKIGFEPLQDEPYLSPDEHSTGYGLQVQPMMMDLAGMVRLDTATRTASEMREVLSPYVMERFFKRLVLRELVHPFPRMQSAGG